MGLKERAVEERTVSSDRQCGFEVRIVGVAEDPELDTFTVGITNDEDRFEPHLLFAVSIGGADEQDRRLGQDTYSISNEDGVTVYGCVTSCVLEGRMLTLRFSPDAQSTLGMDETCRFPLLVDEDSIATLVDGLERVLTVGYGRPSELVLRALTT